MLVRPCVLIWLCGSLLEPPKPTLTYSFDIARGIGDSARMSRLGKVPKDEQARHDQADALLDEALRMTFPASDPVAISFDNATGGGRADPTASSDAEQMPHPAEHSTAFRRKI